MAPATCAGFTRIVLPLSSNALTALAIFVFLGHYNDLFWPFIVTNSLETRTLPVGLTILNSAYGMQYRPMVLSGAVLSTIPHPDCLRHLPAPHHPGRDPDRRHGRTLKAPA